jgi:hypothetical protein
MRLKILAKRKQFVIVSDEYCQYYRIIIEDVVREKKNIHDAIKEKGAKEKPGRILQEFRNQLANSAIPQFRESANSAILQILQICEFCNSVNLQILQSRKLRHPSPPPKFLFFLYCFFTLSI